MKSLVGFVLGIVGSIFAIFASGFFAVLGVLILLGREGLSDIGGSLTLIEFAGSMGWTMILIGVWFLVLSVFGLVYSGKMNRGEGVRVGGIGCVIVGILTINIFLIIGGVIGIISSFSRNQNFVN